MNPTCLQPDRQRHGSNRRCVGRKGFTLIELLLVISIIAVLSSLALFVLRGAREDASNASTDMRLRQITAALEQRMLDYEFRRIPVKLNDPFFGIGNDRVLLNQVRNRIIADLVHLELPGVWQWDYVNSVWVDPVPGDDYLGIAQIPVRNPINSEIFPSPELTSWLMEVQALGLMTNVDTPMTGLIAKLTERQSSIVHQREIALLGGVFFNDTSESLTWVLQNTDMDGVSAADSMGSRPFIVDQTFGLQAITDGFEDRLVYRVMYVDQPLDPNEQLDPSDTDAFLGRVPPDFETPFGSGMIPLADAIRYDDTRQMVDYDRDGTMDSPWFIDDVKFENIRVQVLSVNDQ